MTHGRARVRPEARALGAARGGLLAAASLALALQTAAGARPVEVPLTLDAPFLRGQLAAHVFSEDGAAGLRGPDRCSEARLELPALAFAPPARVALASRAAARAGLALGPRCLGFGERRGVLEVVEEPWLEPGGARLRFRVVDSRLALERPPLLGGERLGRWIGDALRPQLEDLLVDLGPLIGDLRALLPLFAAPGAEAAAERMAASVALGGVRVAPEGVVLALRLEVDDAPLEVARPERPLSELERAAVRRAARRLDAFLTFVVKHAGRDALEPGLRRELLAVLLDARHALLAALAGKADPDAPAPEGDPVRALFVESWARLAPLLRTLDDGVSAESGLRYLAFVAAGDALAALDAAGPSLGLELSSDGLRKLARTLAPAAAEDPLARPLGVDPELRALFGFGVPLPPPSPIEPEPQAPPEPPPPDAPHGSLWLERALGTLGALVSAPAAAVEAPGPERVPGEAPDPELRRLSARVSAWAPTRADAPSFLPLAGQLLRRVASDAHGAGPLPGERAPFFTRLVLATGWQESCWRQVVLRGPALVPLRSPAGAVGIMQVSEGVWRGFYDAASLRRDAGYNGRAGSEILLHYLRDYALARERELPDAESLARASYAMYNGGPRHALRWRDPGTAPSLRAIDAAFLAKYEALAAGDDGAVLACFAG
jgi:hypothetical protein